jgi:hypothetical protein
LNALQNNFSSDPIGKLCHFYLPQTNKAILITTNSNRSVATGDLNPSTQFIIQKMKKEGLEVIIIESDDISKTYDLGSQEIINYFTSLSNFYLM